MRVEWTMSARRDLSSAHAYVAQDNPAAAGRQVELILVAVLSLLRFPEIGRKGRRPTTRELVVINTPYVIPYRIKGEVIEIIRVLHGKQRWPISSR